jgi:hypothetical protein
VDRYIVSTPPGRALLNRPEIVGCEYTRMLQSAMEHALRSAPFRHFLVDTPPTEICVLHILRGGLNFGLREALHDAFGFFRHGSVFLSAERRRLADGTWTVIKDLYRQLDLPPEAVLRLGDVVATGVTLEHTLGALEDRLRRNGDSLRRLYVFTIGCERLEEILERYDARLREACPAFEGSCAIYLEGRFTLAREDTPTRGVVPDTDLLRRGALLTPEFAASQHENAAYPLERCVIYDAGSRACNVPAYVADVLEHWRALGDRGRAGTTLAEALAERGFETEKGAAGGTAAALVRLCEVRIEALLPLAGRKALSR